MICSRRVFEASEWYRHYRLYRPYVGVADAGADSRYLESGRKYVDGPYHAHIGYASSR